MIYSTITSKNQTTLPKEVVEALKMRPWHRICYEIGADWRVILKAKIETFASVAAGLPPEEQGSGSAVHQFGENSAVVPSSSSFHTRHRAGSGAKKEKPDPVPTIEDMDLAIEEMAGKRFLRSD